MSQIRAALEALDNRIVNSDNAENAFLDCRDIFEEIISLKLYLEQLHLFVSAIALGDSLQGKSRGNTVDLWTTPRFGLVLKSVQDKTRGLIYIPGHAMYAPISGGSVAFDLYHLPRNFDGDCFSPEIILDPPVHELVMPSVTIVNNARLNVADIFSPTNRPQVVLMLESAAFGGLRWSFDRLTRKALSLSAQNPSDTSVEIILELLAAVRSPESIPVIEALTSHPMHFVRWRAVQTIGAIDVDAGIRHATTATSDAHPHVRDAARKTLDRLNG